MSGPCLCGDPYCGSCGNPEMAKYEDWCDSFMEMIDNEQLDEHECLFLQELIPEIISKLRIVSKAVTDTIQKDMHQIEDYL